MSYKDYPPGRQRRILYSEELRRRQSRFDTHTFSVIQTESINSYIRNPEPVDLHTFIINTEVVIDKRHENFCCICQNSETLMLMRKIINCCHIFHIRCLDIWIKDHDDCPMCRCKI